MNAAKLLWPVDFAKSARENFSNFHYQLGGDHALHYNQNLAELLWGNRENVDGATGDASRIQAMIKYTF